METLEELQKIGWAKLNGDQRKLWQELKGNQTAPTTSDTITLKKEDLFKMVEEIAEEKVQKFKLAQQTGMAQAHGKWQDVDTNQKRKHTARMKLWRKTTDDDWGMIIDWKHLRFDYDENTRTHDKDIYRITLLYEDGAKKEEEIMLKEFAEINDIEQVDIVEMDKKTQERIDPNNPKIRRSPQVGGYTFSPGYDMYGLKMPDAGGIYVDNIVTQDKITCTIRRQNGQTLTLDSSRLNA